MKRLLTIGALITLSFTACEKDDKDSSCANGTIRYSNTSANPYKIYLDGGYKETLQTSTYIEYTIPKGSHILKAIQASGYLLYPTEREATIFLNGCDSKEFIFP